MISPRGLFFWSACINIPLCFTVDPSFSSVLKPQPCIFDEVSGRYRLYSDCLAISFDILTMFQLYNSWSRVSMFSQCNVT